MSPQSVTEREPRRRPAEGVSRETGAIDALEAASTDRIAKLPKWAQDLIREQREERFRVADLLASVTSRAGSLQSDCDTFMVSYSGGIVQQTPIGQGRRVRFNLDSDVFEVFTTEDNEGTRCLSVRNTGQGPRSSLSISPRTSNDIQVVAL